MSRRARVVVGGVTALSAAYLFGVATGVLLPIESRSAPTEPAVGGAAVTIAGGASVFDGLGLSTEQRSAVDEILGSFRAWADSAMSGQRDSLDERADRAQEAVLELLDAEQRAEYLSRLDSVSAMMRMRRPRAPEGGEPEG